MYHTDKLSTMDEHTHRLLWRDLDDKKPPDQYALTTVTFGDKPSGTIATLALRHTVEKFGKEYPDVQDMIINNTYVDDILYSTDTVENAFKLIQDAEKILSQGSFRIKHWIVSGHYESCKVNVIKSDHDKILGLKWNPLEDHFFFTVKLNFSSRIRKVRSGPNLNSDEIDDKFPEHLTRRMLLSQIASIYDPLGFAVPVLLKAKILMRLVISKGESKDGGIKWDDPLDISTVKECKMFFKELYELERLTFRRSLIPSNVVGKPSLIIFSDGSMQAYGACAYVRWQIGEDEFESHLIAARNKIAPMKQMSIPRLELCAALMAARLRESILKEFTWKFEAIYHIVDSSIVRSQIQKDELTDRIGIIMTVNNASHENGDIQLIDVNRYSDYYKLLRVTCRVMNVFKYKSFKGILRSPTVQGITDAEILWVKEMQKSMTDWETRFKRLGPSIERGVIVVGQRISKWLKDNWNQENFMLIPNKHPVTRLYISCLHKVDHAGIETTLCKIQRKFWIPGARKLIRTIKNKCVTCRKLSKKVEDQCMGQVRAERMKPAPPFYHTAVDLFGPLTIRDSVKKRTYGKAFGIIFNCLVTRAVYLDLAMGYSTDDFLTTFQRFIAIRGAPKFMYSDRGTQLISASNKIESIGEKEGVTWIFNMPSDAPWYNGVSEALIKSVKRSICVSIGDSILNFGELQTALFSIANLMNERPIGLKPGFSLELGSYLCPNDLLLGRSSCHCPIGLYEIDGDHKRRLRFIQNIINSFWKKWQRDYFPSMLIRQMWHTAKRIVKVGDVVLVQDSNIVRGTWKLAQEPAQICGRGRPLPHFQRGSTSFQRGSLPHFQQVVRFHVSSRLSPSTFPAGRPLPHFQQVVSFHISSRSSTYIIPAGRPLPRFQQVVHFHISSRSSLPRFKKVIHFHISRRSSTSTFPAGHPLSYFQQVVHFHVSSRLSPSTFPAGRPIPRFQQVVSFHISSRSSTFSFPAGRPLPRFQQVIHFHISSRSSTSTFPAGHPLSYFQQVVHFHVSSRSSTSTFPAGHPLSYFQQVVHFHVSSRSSTFIFPAGRPLPRFQQVIHFHISRRSSTSTFPAGHPLSYFQQVVHFHVSSRSSTFIFPAGRPLPRFQQVIHFHFPAGRPLPRFQQVIHFHISSRSSTSTFPAGHPLSYFQQVVHFHVSSRSSTFIFPAGRPLPRFQQVIHFHISSRSSTSTVPAGHPLSYFQQVVHFHGSSRSSIFIFPAGRPLPRFQQVIHFHISSRSSTCYAHRSLHALPNHALCYGSRGFYV
ncbi:uncharacterized protein LOC125034852 [Penaeus chinensis]|uniref:uncharacterized protein LOC125034852 n=1 Tax=Penaeus chinensis TaxID=139456 RepID=UPI001FB5DA91|nr:uncharacterized protein LOC125034852 [Penaeus chinensis]